MGNTATRDLILSALMVGEPLSCRDIIGETGLSKSQVYNALYRCWSPEMRDLIR